MKRRNREYNANAANLYANAANLKNANFTGVKLIKANLTGADFTGANLFLTDLTGADMKNSIVHIKWKPKMNPRLILNFGEINWIK